MIRRLLRGMRMVVLGGLTLATVWTGILWVASHHESYICQVFEIDEWHARGTALDGRGHLLVTEGLPASVYILGFTPAPLFAFHRSPDGRPASYEVISPLWAPLALFATYPLIAAIAFIRGPLRRHHRRRLGLCVACGYNLKGNESGTCPECGAGS